MESRGNGFNWSTESYNKEKPVHIDDDLLTSVNGLRLLLFQISQQIALLGVFMQHTVDMVHQMTSLLTRGENL